MDPNVELRTVPCHFESCQKFSVAFTAFTDITKLFFLNRRLLSGVGGLSGEKLGDLFWCMLRLDGICMTCM